MIQQRTLFTYEVIWGDERLVSINGREIWFSPTQHALLLPLLDGSAKSYGQVVACVYHYTFTFDPSARRMLDKHIERMRAKMQESPLHIYTIPNYGYILLPRHPPDACTGPVPQRKEILAR